MMRRAPFQTKSRAKVNVMPVGAGDMTLYLLKRGFLTPIEDYETDASEKRGAEAQVIYLQAVKNCATLESIDSNQAQEKIFPSKREDGVVVEGASLLDYLEPAQTSKMLSLQSVTREDKYHVVTLMIRERLAYPIVLKANAKVKSNQLESIEPVPYQLAIGNRFLFGETTVEIDDLDNKGFDYDVESVFVKPLDRSLEMGEVGYLLDVKGQVKVGDPEWTLELTKSLLGNDLIDAIYAFYKSEGPQPEESNVDENLTLTNQSPSSKSTSTPSQPTGTPSIGESKPTSSETLGSTPKTLATNRPG